ncbi:hypothetical protein LFM09_08290 [Lentzea alba]|uniref:hypothetical protein n=1 Tax=Lentzea alba TaxID=2714351 RepID=UPI0039BF0DDC
MTRSQELNRKLDRAFDGLEKNLRESVEKFNAAVDHVTGWGPLLGPGAVLFMHHELQRIKTALKKLVQLVTTALEHYTPVVSLLVQSFNWVHHVQTPMQNLAYLKSESHLAYEWEGKASSAYQDKASAQNDAIAVVAAKALEASNWLTTIAQRNVDYMTSLATMAVDFLNALVKASIEGVAVFTLPLAVKDLADAIGDLTGKQLTAMVQIGKRMVDAFADTQKLASIMSDMKLPGGRWPQAVSG